MLQEQNVNSSTFCPGFTASFLQLDSFLVGVYVYKC